MDKDQTKELLLSLKLILVGIAFWVIKPRYFLFFLIKPNTLLSIVGLEIVGTVIMVVGLTMIHRIYPFAHTIIALLLTYLVFATNILDIIFYKNEIYQVIALYFPILMSIVLILISKIMESGLRYFKNRALSRKWRYLTFIIFFGYSLPFYTFVSLKVCNFISFNGIFIDTKAILIFLPLVITMVIFVLYYLIMLIKSFNFLSRIQNKGKLNT